MTTAEYYKLAFNTISKYESFNQVAVWDVNAWRIGFGSSTITFEDGTFRKTKRGDDTTIDNATRDLYRKIKEFESRTIQQVGGDKYWNKLSPYAKVGILSLVYNYGSITHPKIITAIQTGNNDLIAESILKETINDNFGTKYYQGLRNRRQKEADLVRTPYVFKSNQQDINENLLIYMLIAAGVIIVASSKFAKGN